MAEKEETLDPKFFERADAYIALANGHITNEIHPGLVSNSFMYGGSRYNSWVAAAGFTNGEDMKKEKKEILEFFAEQYKLMLEENLNDYIDNYDYYMGKSKEDTRK